MNSAGEGGPSKNTRAATRWVGVGELWGCVGRAALHLPLDMTTQAPQQFCPLLPLYRVSVGKPKLAPRKLTWTPNMLGHVVPIEVLLLWVNKRVFCGALIVSLPTENLYWTHVG